MEDEENGNRKRRQMEKKTTTTNEKEQRKKEHSTLNRNNSDRSTDDTRNWEKKAPKNFSHSKSRVGLDLIISFHIIIVKSKFYLNFVFLMLAWDDHHHLLVNATDIQSFPRVCTTSPLKLKLNFDSTTLNCSQWVGSIGRRCCCFLSGLDEMEIWSRTQID